MVTKTIPKKKKGKGNMVAEEPLQTAEKRREAKGKGEKERKTHLNAEFQRIARKDNIALRALGSITTGKVGGDGIPADLFHILKDDAVKMLHSLCQQIWKIQQWPQDWIRSVFIPIPKTGNAKE